jgi:hypothetical protein
MINASFILVLLYLFVPILVIYAIVSIAIDARRSGGCSSVRKRRARASEASPNH